MFCPNCKAEYAPDQTVCADCHVPLVKELLPEEEGEKTEYLDSEDFKPVFTFYSPGEVAIAKTILDEARIRYMCQSEFASLVHPFTTKPTVFCVYRDDIPAAIELLKDLEESAPTDQDKITGADQDP